MTKAQKNWTKLKQLKNKKKEGNPRKKDIQCDPCDHVRWRGNPVKRRVEDTFRYRKRDWEWGRLRMFLGHLLITPLLGILLSLFLFSSSLLLTLLPNSTRYCSVPLTFFDSPSLEFDSVGYFYENELDKFFTWVQVQPPCRDGSVGFYKIHILPVSFLFGLF